ncbi:MAG: glutamate--tRNA ligase [Alphaproteobacteria bacterium]|nr:glutamate--tRNA ligase [Alphaproteobacteria bacterium]
MTVITRFAPSPTGLLHVGNLRTALICWLYSKSHGGQFILRLDDTDKERSKQEYADAIQDDLKWLGLPWDRVETQSSRLGRYQEIKERLLASGRLYPCYETQEELQVKRKMQLSRGMPPIYDRSALKLTPEEIKQYESEGRKAHYRFKMTETPIQWDDMVRGPTLFEGKNLSDPIVIREDGTPTYLLPSTVDDIDMGITLIIRGEDHVTNTAIQIQMFEALNATPPHFAHLALIKSKEAEISKRLGGFDIRGLREDGIHPMAISSLFAHLGTSLPVEAYMSIDDLKQNFEMSIFGRAAANYDVADLVRLNSKILHQLSFNDVKPHLDTLGIHDVTPDFWLTIRTNVEKLTDVRDWWHICEEAISPVIVDSEFATIASSVLPAEPWSAETWSLWTNAVKEKTGRKGKELFLPLRQALTACDHGPEMRLVLPLIGRDRALKRLQGHVA